MFENGLAPVWNTKLDEFGIMGAGVPLYFRLLVRGACDVARGVCWPSPGHLDVLQKYLASSFLIMTVLSAPIWFFSAVGSGLDEVDRLVRDYSVEVTERFQYIRDKMFEELRRHFSEEQIVELTLRIALCGFFNRFNDALMIGMEDGVVTDMLAAGGTEAELPEAAAE